MAYDREKHTAHVRKYYRTAKGRRAFKIAADNSRAKRRELLDSLRRRPCADCGIQYPPYVMEFDHCRGKKTQTISSMALSRASELKLLAEIEKCDIVCANCHKIRTFLRKQQCGVRSSDAMPSPTRNAFVSQGFANPEASDNSFRNLPLWPED